MLFLRRKEEPDTGLGWRALHTDLTVGRWKIARDFSSRNSVYFEDRRLLLRFPMSFHRKRKCHAQHLRNSIYQVPVETSSLYQLLVSWDLHNASESEVSYS